MKNRINKEIVYVYAIIFKYYHNESEFHTKGREKLEEHRKHDVEWEESDTNNTYYHPYE